MMKVIKTFEFQQIIHSLNMVGRIVDEEGGLVELTQGENRVSFRVNTREEIQQVIDGLERIKDLI